MFTPTDSPLESLVCDQDAQIDTLSRVLAEVVRRLRPDLALIYVDEDAPMVADLITQHGEDGLIEELLGYDELNLESRCSCVSLRSE